MKFLLVMRIMTMTECSEIKLINKLRVILKSIDDESQAFHFNLLIKEIELAIADCSGCIDEMEESND